MTKQVRNNIDSSTFRLLHTTLLCQNCVYIALSECTAALPLACLNSVTTTSSNLTHKLSSLKLTQLCSTHLATKRASSCNFHCNALLVFAITQHTWRTAGAFQASLSLRKAQTQAWALLKSHRLRLRVRLSQGLNRLQQCVFRGAKERERTSSSELVRKLHSYEMSKAR